MLVNIYQLCCSLCLSTYNIRTHKRKHFSSKKSSGLGNWNVITGFGSISHTHSLGPEFSVCSHAIFNGSEDERTRKNENYYWNGSVSPKETRTKVRQNIWFRSAKFHYSFLFFFLPEPKTDKKSPSSYDDDEKKLKMRNLLKKRLSVGRSFVRSSYDNDLIVSSQNLSFSSQ